MYNDFQFANANLEYDDFYVDPQRYSCDDNCYDTFPVYKDNCAKQYIPDPWQRCNKKAPILEESSQNQKTFYYPLNSCTLSWAPIGTQGSVVGCKSEAGVVSTECRWNRGVTDFAAYQCREVVTSPESVVSVEKHDACILSLDPAVGMARFSCDLVR